MWYAEVILPVPLDAVFTYAIPSELEEKVKVGHRVIVPFNTRRYLTGIVRSIVSQAPKGFAIKEIAMVIDDYPIVRHPQLKLWEWIADYYLCAVGDVYKSAVPAALKMESETFVELNPDYEPDESKPLTEREMLIVMELTTKGHRRIDALAKTTGVGAAIHSLIDKLMNKGAVIISEKIVERYRAIKEKYIVPTFGPDDLAQAFALVKGSKKQEQTLMSLIELSKVNRHDLEPQPVKQAVLLDRSQTTSTILNALIKKGLAQREIKQINRFKFDGTAPGELPILSPEQNAARDAITDLWREKSTVLLHGVTSSGKTEVYSHLIDLVMSRGEQVLFLVPEIALTTQLTRRLQAIFGNRVIVYHSKFSDNERVDIWKTMLSRSEPCVVLGARSSLFLPFSRLGLVIVDEEHEPSYKQSDPAPRYNARDTALVLASMHGAKSLLGSATPSIETYYKAQQGKFGLVTLDKRWSNLPLPPVHIVDMSIEAKKKAVCGPLSLQAVKSINDATLAQRQAILFRNRRGFAPMVRCKQCAWVPKCLHCDVSLTYHNAERQLVCHYCGAVYPLPNLCPQCGQPSIEVIGYGTERVEGEIEALFPGRKVLRMDLDTTRNKNGYEALIDEFSNHKADILVGTQMVTKGLDFKDVSSVVVINADEMIDIPDFKAAERTFNMLEQVAGRAGRNTSEGVEVIVQTRKPTHPLLGFVSCHDYHSYYEAELSERKSYLYPPFSRIIYIYLKHSDATKLSAMSQAYANLLRSLLGNRVQGPDKPHVARIKSLYIQKIMIKLESTASMAKLREVLRQAYRTMAADPTVRTSTIYYDVDP